MIKRIVSVLLVLVVMCGMLAACGKSTQISSSKAQKIALEDMGISSSEATVHVHSAETENGIYYNVFVTHGEENMTYVISNTGEIVHKVEGGHSH